MSDTKKEAGAGSLAWPPRRRAGRRQHGRVGLLPVALCRGAVRAARDRGLDRHGLRRHLPGPRSSSRGCRARPRHRRTLRLHAVGVVATSPWVPRGLGIPDLDLRVAAGHRNAVAFTGYLMKMVSAFQGEQPPHRHRADAGGDLVRRAREPARGEGRRDSSRSVATFTKLVPFAAISPLGLFYVHWDRLAAFNPQRAKPLARRQRGAGYPLTMFAYLGLSRHGARGRGARSRATIRARPCWGSGSPASSTCWGPSS